MSFDGEGSSINAQSTAFVHQSRDQEQESSPYYPASVMSPATAASPQRRVNEQYNSDAKYGSGSFYGQSNESTHSSSTNRSPIRHPHSHSRLNSKKVDNEGGLSAVTPTAANPDDGSSPATYFFTSVISAAQNAASSLAGMKKAGGGNGGGGSGGGHGRSLSDSSVLQQPRHFDEEEEEEQIEDGFQPADRDGEHSKVNDVVIEPLRSAISTLGKGELSLASLGLEDDEKGQQQPPEDDVGDSGGYDDDQQSTQSDDDKDVKEDDGKSQFQTQSEFAQGGTLAIPVMSRSKSRASSLISKQRRKRAQSLDNTIDSVSTTQDEAQNGESTGHHPLTGFAYANKKRNKDFHRLFRSITPDDYLLDDFSCALSKEILVHGRLYVSEKHVCFNSNILGWVTNLVIAFDEIVTLEKKSTAGLFPNGIVVQTLHARHSFASFVSRDSALEFLTSIWKQTSPHQARLDSSSAVTSVRDSDSEGYEEDTDDDDGEEYSDTDEDNGAENVNGAVKEDGVMNGYDHGESEGETFGSFGSSDDEYLDSEEEEEEDRNEELKNEAVQTEDGDKKDNGDNKKDGGDKDKKDEKKDGKGEDEKGADQSGQWPVENLGPETHAPTELGSDPESNGEKHLSTDTLAAPLGVVSNLLFGDDTSWMKRFVLDNQKNINLNDMPPFKPDSNGKKLRSYEYTKPLNAPVGPKQTQCICTDTIENWDLEDKVVVVTSTQTPDVPSGNSFLTKTRMALCWAEKNRTKLVISYWMDWTGKSWLKGAIERGSHDGQTNFATEIVKEIRKSIESGGAPGARKRAASKSAAGQKKKKRSKKKSAQGAEGQPQALQRQKQQQQASGFLGVINGYISQVTGVMNFVPLNQVPVPIWGWAMMIMMVYMFMFRPAGMVSPSPSSSSYDRLDQLMVEEEYEVWKWIDDRLNVNGGADQKKTKNKRQNSDAAESLGKFGKQDLVESIRITEDRLKVLKDRLD